MKFLLAGDWHGYVDAMFVDTVERARLEHGDIHTIFHAGDFGLWPRGGHLYLNELNEVLEELDITLYWIDGNHEWFDRLEEIGAFGADEPTEIRPTIFYVPRGHIFDWDGYRIMGMGGAYSVDKPHRSPGSSWWPQEEIRDEDVERAIYNLAGETVDMLVSHDAPAGIMVPGVHAAWKQNDFPEANANRERLLEVVLHAKPEILVHGHYHVSYEGAIVLAPETDREHKLHVVGLDHNAGRGTNMIVFDTEERSYVGI